jgi:hypothetical protein
MALPRSVPLVDLVYDRECPNVSEARALLHEALTQLSLSPIWREWDREGNDTPLQLRGLGSPTILVDGVDVSPIDSAANEGANCCRLYHHGSRFRGIPEFAAVTTAITRHMGVR